MCGWQVGSGTRGVLCALAIIQCAAHSKAQVSCHGRAAGDRAAAREAFAVAEAKTAGVGQKMDLAFSLLRLDMAAGDWQVLSIECQPTFLASPCRQ